MLKTVRADVQRRARNRRSVAQCLVPLQLSQTQTAVAFSREACISAKRELVAARRSLWELPAPA
jgi:hypothetical protein